MPYAKQTWIDGTSVVNATRMTHLETGIETLDLDKADKTGIDAAGLTGTLAIDRLPSGGLIVVDKAKAFYGAAGSWPTTRPTARTDVVVLWLGDVDPGTIAIAGDIIDLVG